MIKRTALLMTILCLLMSATAWSGEKDYGVGIILGEPTGFSGKLWWDDNIAFDGGLAWSIIGDANIHVHGDVVWHNWSVLEEAFDLDDSARIPLYYGIGGRLKSGEDTRVGMRFVIGAAYIFENAPFDIFLEIAPIMDFAPKTELQLNSAIGARFWF